MSHWAPHVDPRYERGLADIVGLLLQMGDQATAMARRGLVALTTGDVAASDEVVAADDAVDALEVRCDAAVMTLIARHAPVGADLRLATCALKVVTDLERVGDMAVSIARTGREVSHPMDPVLRDAITALGERAIAVLSHAVDALRERRAGQAGALVLEDPLVDQLNRDAFKLLTTFAVDHPERVSEALALAAACRHLERIGDHAVNIGEMVVFFLEGRVLRHAPVEDRLK